MNEALVYAAGFGTRMGELTRTRPKPLLRLNGRTLIDHAIDRLRAAGVTKFHVNAHYLGDQIVDHFADADDVLVHLERPQILETGGTLKSLAARLPETLLTQNADAMFVDGLPMAKMRAGWHLGLDALLVLVPVAQAPTYHGAGDFYFANGVLERRGTRAQAPYIFASTQLIRPRIAHEVAEDVFSTNLIWDRLIAAGRIGAIIHDAPWVDLGDARALELATRLFAA